GGSELTRRSGAIDAGLSKVKCSNHLQQGDPAEPHFSLFAGDLPCSNPAPYQCGPRAIRLQSSPATLSSAYAPDNPRHWQQSPAATWPSPSAAANRSNHPSPERRAHSSTATSLPPQSGAGGLPALHRAPLPADHYARD